MKPELQRYLRIVVVALALDVPCADAVRESFTERDPFMSQKAPFCNQASAPPQTWRLGGIVGRDADYQAWLVYAGGRWEPRSAEALLDAHRRLLNVDASGITVEALQGCGLPWKIMLKGKRYAQDSMFADSAQPQTALRGHGRQTPVSGVR